MGYGMIMDSYWQRMGCNKGNYEITFNERTKPWWGVSEGEDHCFRQNLAWFHLFGCCLKIGMSDQHFWVCVGTMAPWFLIDVRYEWNERPSCCNGSDGAWRLFISPMANSIPNDPLNNNRAALIKFVNSCTNWSLNFMVYHHVPYQKSPVYE